MRLCDCGFPAVEGEEEARSRFVQDPSGVLKKRSARGAFAVQAPLRSLHKTASRGPIPLYDDEGVSKWHTLIIYIILSFTDQNRQNSYLSDIYRHSLSF